MPNPGQALRREKKARQDLGRGEPVALRRIEAWGMKIFEHNLVTKFLVSWIRQDLKGEGGNLLISAKFSRSLG